MLFQKHFSLTHASPPAAAAPSLLLLRSHRCVAVQAGASAGSGGYGGFGGWGKKLLQASVAKSDSTAVSNNGQPAVAKSTSTATSTNNGQPAIASSTATAGSSTGGAQPFNGPCNGGFMPLAPLPPLQPLQPMQPMFGPCQGKK